MSCFCARISVPNRHVVGLDILRGVSGIGPIIGAIIAGIEMKRCDFLLTMRPLRLNDFHCRVARFICMTLRGNRRDKCVSRIIHTERIFALSIKSSDENKWLSLDENKGWRCRLS